jgi:succinate dehydrogenase / fumarate reductase membrane anchor subunit
MAQGSGDRRSELGRVRGLGTAKEGVQHWWAQRATAVALIPLAVWFLASVVCLMGGTRADLVAWLGSPFSAGLMILFLLALFWHALLGLQVVIEDYVHHEGRKLATLFAVKGLILVLAAASVASVIKLMLQG